MRVPARCLGLCMAEELAYKGKAQPGPRPDRSEAVPQVVNPHIGQIDSVPLLEFLSPNRFLLLSLCQRLHPPPGALQVLQVVVRVLRGGNYPAHHLGSLSQQLQRRGAGAAGRGSPDDGLGNSLPEEPGRPPEGLEGPLEEGEGAGRGSTEGSG